MDTVIRSPKLSKQSRLLTRERAEDRAPLPEGSTEAQAVSTASLGAGGEAGVDVSEQPAPGFVPTPGDEPLSSDSDSPAQSEADEDLRLRIDAELRAAHADELSAAREEAIEAGREEGYRSGHAEAIEEYSKQQEALRSVIQAAQNSLDQQIDGLVDIVTAMTFEATTKILGDALVQKEGVIAIVRELIGRVKSAEKLLVRVSPHDYELLESARADLLSGFEHSEVELLADDRVALGGCLLETPSGSLDGRLEIQLQHFADTLLAAKARWPDPELESSK